MKILYLSYLTDKIVFSEIFQAELEPSVARQKFESTLMKEMIGTAKENDEEIQILSCVPFNERVQFRVARGEFLGKEIRYIWWKAGIISALKAALEVNAAVREWQKQTQGQERLILTYATNPIVILPILFRKCKMITICSEVPRFRVMGNSIKAKLKKEYYHFMNERMDGYIFFSKYMEEVCNKKGRPYIVVEGMPDIQDNILWETQKQEREEAIFYAGGLNAENGIVELLEAFVRMGRDDVKLILCGIGNVVETVKQYAEKYSNIVFLGTLENKKVLELEKKATLLINPRKRDGILTRYSFPSKTFEYFTSGTPAVLTRLDGIPEEYYQYCYTCDSSSADALKNDLEKILTIPQEERAEKAKNAYQFILKEKTAKMQTEKIIRFLHSIV